MTRIAIRSALLVSTIGAALGGCGDNHAPPGAPGPVDAPPGRARAVVVAGDFVPGHPGVLSTLDLATLTVRANVGPAMAVGSDPLLRHLGGELLIINRGENNVTILDDRTLRLKARLGTGPGSNPQDVAVRGDKLYVPTFGTKGVTVLTRGKAATVTIDLSVDDPDGLPNCNSVYLVGKDLYVSCELLDENFRPRGPGKVYVVDPATGAIERRLTLAYANPFGLFTQIPAGAPHGGDLVISTVENFATAPGCIVRVATGATPAAAGCLLENAALGGFATRIAFQVAGGRALMLAAVAIPPRFTGADLRAYDLAGDLLRPAPVSPSTQVIADVAACPDGQIVVSDASPKASGLRVYEGATERTTAPLPVGLPPRSAHGLVCY